MTEKPTETTNKSPFKIKVRRTAKARSVQPSPVVAEVDAFPTHSRVPLANARRKAPLQATEILEGPGPGSGPLNAVAVSDPNSGSRTADPVEGAGPQGQGSLTNMETEESDVEVYPTTSRKRLAISTSTSTSTRRTHRPGPGWQQPYRKCIEERVEPLEREFTGTTETVRRDLEAAEKTRGGPKGILGKLIGIAHKIFVQKLGDGLQDDNANQEEGSQDLLECICQVMIVEARIQESSKSALKTRTLSRIPPGGLLGVKGVPGESIPPMAGLCIDQYSNATYWQFAPYLESVRCDRRS